MKLTFYNRLCYFARDVRAWLYRNRILFLSILCWIIAIGCAIGANYQNTVTGNAPFHAYLSFAMIIHGVLAAALFILWLGKKTNGY